MKTFSDNKNERNTQNQPNYMIKLELERKVFVSRTQQTIDRRMVQKNSPEKKEGLNGFVLPQAMNYVTSMQKKRMVEEILLIDPGEGSVLCKNWKQKLQMS